MNLKENIAAEPKSTVNTKHRSRNYSIFV